MGLAKKKKAAPKKAKKPTRTARLNLMIVPELKRDMHSYAERHHTSLSSIIVKHFVHLLEKEREPNVEQI